MKGGYRFQRWLRLFLKKDDSPEARHDPFKDLRPMPQVEINIKRSPRHRAWKKLFGGIACPPYQE